MAGHDVRTRGTESIGDAAEIPDLDIAPSRRSPSSTPSRSRVAQSGPAGGADLEIDPSLDSDWISGLGSGLLELDLPKGANSVSTATNPPDQHRWPTASRPALGSVSIDPTQVSRLRSWGDPPDAWWQTPFYALAVYRGQRGLTRDLAETSAELHRVETRRDACLSEMSLQLRSSLEGNAHFDAALRAVHTTEAALEQSRAKLEQTETSSAAELEAIETAIRTSSAELAELQNSLGAAQQALERAELDSQREQARVQRLGIERRNLEQAQLDSDKKQEKLKALSEQAAALMPAIDTCRIAVQSRRAEQSQIKANAAQKQSEMENLRLRRVALERDLGAHLDSAGAEVAKVNSARTAALAELGRGILQTKGQVPVDSAYLAELVRFDDAVAALCHREQLYLAALGSYDRPAVRRGLKLTALTLLVLIAWSVWRVIAG